MIRFKLGKTVRVGVRSLGRRQYLLLSPKKIDIQFIAGFQEDGDALPVKARFAGRIGNRFVYYVRVYKPIKSKTVRVFANSELLIVNGRPNNMPKCIVPVRTTGEVCCGAEYLEAGLYRLYSNRKRVVSI